MAVSSNQDVQNALNTLGYGPLAVDGILGPLSQAAVRKFQTDHSLTVDGIAGPQTKAALTAALANAGNAGAQADITLDNVLPPVNIVAQHIPPSPGQPAVTIHTNTTSGATTAKPFGTPTSPTSPLAAHTGATPAAAGSIANKVSAMTTGEKVVAAVLGGGALAWAWKKWGKK